MYMYTNNRKLLLYRFNYRTINSLAALDDAQATPHKYPPGTEETNDAMKEMVGSVSVQH